MKQKELRITFLVIAALLALPLYVVYAAGGQVTGKITDPKGAPIAGAAVVLTDSGTNQIFRAVTDQQGHYNFEGLPAGTYSVTVSAAGFSEARRDEVKVDEALTATIDLKLEIQPLEAAVTISPGGTKANSDPVYQKLRQTGRSETDFVGPFATVNDLVIKRDAAVFTLHSGEVYFGAPIEGRFTSAVFIGEGDMTLVPPTLVEKHSLSLFIQEEKLAEQFSRLVIRFTDKTFDELQASPKVKMGAGGSQAAKARELYRDNQQLLRRELHDNGELRTLADIYGPQRPGYFTAFIAGSKHGKLIYVLDPLGIPQVSPEEVSLSSYGDSDGGIWTAFHLTNEYARGTASSAEDHRLFDITRHEIDGAIHGAQITASDRVTFRALVAGRVLPFSLYRTLRVSRVLDSQGNDLNFIQENKDEDADFAVIMPQPLEAGKDYSITVQYAGNDALRDTGSGNFILIPRSTWYPNNSGTQFGDRAAFEITMRYPKGNTFVATGAPLEPDQRDGDQMIAKWSSGKTDLAVAGFNYGKFKKKELADKETGYNIEFYANEELPDSVKAMQHDIERAESSGIQTFTTLGSITTTGMANTALGDAENATRLYTAFFGKLPYTRIAMTQQPAGNFGQAWPTLIFMPFIAFIDTTQRAQMLGVRGGTDNFWRYVAPHEIAHQWWGHIVGWDSYHDQWMSEGFAEFSASLYVQYVRKDPAKFLEFWDAQRELIIQARPQTRDKRPYTIGPVTQGYRLNSAKTGGVARFMIYPKGAYILHMLRMMFHDPREGDKHFQETMKDFVQTYFNRDVSTEDFKAMIEKHMTPEMNLDGDGRMDWFFKEWVYGTEMPSYKFEYQLGDGGSTLTGRVTQSGVSDNFKMLVPIYLDYGKGWVKFGSARMTGNTTIDIKDQKIPPGAKRAALCAFDDVLALTVQNSK